MYKNLSDSGSQSVAGTSSIRIAWELVRDANAMVPPQTTESGALGWGPEPCVLTSPPGGFLFILKSENHCCRVDMNLHRQVSMYAILGFRR